MFSPLRLLVGVMQTGFLGQDIYAETVYDSLGRVGYKSANYLAADPLIRWTQFDYDALGRTVKTTAPDDSITTSAYNGRTSSVTNNSGVTSARTVNGQGKVISITDAQGTGEASSVTYEYDNWGNLSKTVDAAGNVTTMGYDLRGRKIQLADPDMGTWSYVVDALGHVTSQTDAKSQTTTYSYDVLGRMKRRLESDLDSNWYYESNALGVVCPMSVGKLCETTSSNGYFRRHTYDNLGRLNSQTTHLDADYTAAWTFDAAGRVATQTYPSTVASFASPLSVSYNYNASGILQSVGSGSTAYWTRNSENADGNVTGETYGNGVMRARGYDPIMGRLTSLQAGLSGSPGAVQNQTYGYDTLGRLNLRQDSVAGTSETFGHDALSRLTVANITAPGLGTQTTSTSFNAIGNITSKSGVGTYLYPAPGAGRPHAVSGVSGTVNGVNNPTYSYDANGNMLTDGARTFSWTSFNMPSTLAKLAQPGSPGAGTSAFLYGPEHQRTKQTWTESAKTLTTYYLADPGFEKVINSQTGITEFKHHVKVGSSVVAVLNRRSDGAEDVKYLLADHLGSTSVVTDTSGLVVERLAFDPWGDRRTASGANAGASDPTNLIVPITTTRGYTGHEGLDQGGMGLVHMNGRVYDPTLSRFISPDPVIQAPYYSQSFNRFSYVWNSPLMAVDPTGFLAQDLLPQGQLPRVEVTAITLQPVEIRGKAENSGTAGMLGMGLAVYSMSPMLVRVVPLVAMAARNPVVTVVVAGTVLCSASEECRQTLKQLAEQAVKNLSPALCTAGNCDKAFSEGQSEEKAAESLSSGAARPPANPNAPPPDNAYEPDGPKAPGRPTAADGFEPPKGGDQWVRNPNGRGYGWLASDGRVWVPTGPADQSKGDSHGGPHWDVQTGGRHPSYENVRPVRP